LFNSALNAFLLARFIASVKNYEAHAQRNRKLIQLDATPTRNARLSSQNLPSSLIQSGETIQIPTYNGQRLSNDLHHETELVLVVGNDAENISESDSSSVIAGFGIGLDMTLRDVQSEAKKKRKPLACFPKDSARVPLFRQ
jgi:2-keto-4-pentenoate hydratase/2-oxohepta-3-ene-1,7-dioic acid hydratase in catechol pathway